MQKLIFPNFAKICFMVSQRIDPFQKPGKKKLWRVWKQPRIHRFTNPNAKARKRNVMGARTHKPRDNKK